MAPAAAIQHTRDCVTDPPQWHTPLFLDVQPGPLSRHRMKTRLLPPMYECRLIRSSALVPAGTRG